MTSQDVFYIILSILSVSISAAVLYLVLRAYIKVEEFETLILEKKAEVDNIETEVARRKRGVAQNVIDGFAAKEKKPLIAELETLKLKRQFILDKVPLLSFFKR